MADDRDELPLGGFLNGRIIPDAQDLLAIRARISTLETRLSTIDATSLNRVVHRAEIARLKDELSQLGTCEIIAREHVRDNPHQSRNLELFEQQARDARAAESPSPIPPADASVMEQDPPRPVFDRARWRAKRALARGRSRGGLADDDE